MSFKSRIALSAFIAMIALPLAAAGEDFALKLQRQVETSPGAGRYHAIVTEETWNPAETAVIVCDVWDYHHCLNAVKRLEEFAPRLNDLLHAARKRGATIIHAPSDCMAAYADHPARRRAMDAPKVPAPPQIEEWCHRIPSEEQAEYPIDQSDGGEDDDPAEHEQWADKLRSLGRNPKAPWKQQSPAIEIDAAHDYISDRGDEVWNVLAARGVKNVILTGVHVNMCVLGRPFGLRRMVSGGMKTVLMRDLTDAMYNPASWPYVNHFTGNDLVISHIERHVCPTVTSDQVLGGQPFRCSTDRRPRLAIISAEDEYETERTLPPFAAAQLGRDFCVRQIFGSETDKFNVPGLEALADCDLALVSVRRRVLPAESLKLIREFVAAGKPVVGIRTASHAFSLRDQPPPEGHAAWPEFDAQVLGGNYQGHHGNELHPAIRPAASAGDHPLLRGVGPLPFESGGSLYKTSPLAKGAEVLLEGEIDGQPAEPVAWTFRRKDGGKTFYTSLGHKSDFENQAFVQLLTNALRWAADLPLDESLAQADATGARAAFERRWTSIALPDSPALATGGALSSYEGPLWLRCAVRIPAHWKGKSLRVEMPDALAGNVWLNGESLAGEANQGRSSFAIDAENVTPGDANLLVLRCERRRSARALQEAPLLVGPKTISLAGRWQARIGDDPTWCNMPLPAKFGASTDVVFEVGP